jgi:demethylmenaquinone methyltransferase / 2-methoxy-6-polyprenyl-1,4-benzoquinol methylase
MTSSTPPAPSVDPARSWETSDSIPNRIRNLFSAVAPRYDFLNHFLSFGLDIAWRKATARTLQPVLTQPGSLVVDLCCGTGDLTLALSRLSAGKVIGTDFCHPMLLRAHRKMNRQPLPSSLIESDALVLPFRDGSVNAIAIAFGFRNLADYPRGLREMHRVLKPGGKVAILEFSHVRAPIFGGLFRFYFRYVLPRLGDWLSGVWGAYSYLHDSVSRFPDQKTLAAALDEAGFRNVRYRNLTGGVAALHLGEKI